MKDNTSNSDCHGSDLGSDIMDAGDGVGVDESIGDFLLTDKDNRIFAPDTDSCQSASLHSFEGIFDLD